MNIEEQRIMAACDLQPTECTCDQCQSMCKKCPCIGTPHDIKRLIDAGHIDKLALTTWGAGIPAGIAPITMIQLSTKADRSCGMFKDGRCSLHDVGLKPLEGRLALHAGGRDMFRTPEKHCTIQVALTWIDINNIEVIKAVGTAFGHHLNTL